MSKKSIRFFNDREVRAIWDDEHSKWWFSVLDIIAVLRENDDYSKNRNYWKYLKTKLKQEGSQLVSRTNQFKLRAPDCKCIDWSRVNKNDYLAAMRTSVVRADALKTLLRPALTDRIHDRETFMKGIDYSYYYEEA